MKNIFALILYCFATLSLFSQDNRKVATIKDLIPDGWKALNTINGDLNDDAIFDVVLVLEKDDKENIIKNEEGLGPDTLNINPRKIIVALKEGGFFRVIVDNDEFLPSENSSENTCLSDPLAEGGIEITKGTLKIRFHYWLSCGGWHITDKTYTFQYQNNKFELIGFDSESFHRASGEMDNVSINYSTKKKQIVKGGNMFEGVEPIEKWETIKVEKLLNLENITSETRIIGL